MDQATRQELSDLISRALAEDVGDGDRTAMATIPEGSIALATVTQKQPGVIFGIEAAEAALGTLDPAVRFEPLAEEGVWREAGPVLRAEGDARALLAAERTALNILAHLSGVATAAARYVRAVEGSSVTILDTRKTTPGMRLLEKAAVRAGGASNHRIGLWDAYLIKENHIRVAGGITAAVAAARQADRSLLLEVECTNPDEVAEAVEAGADRLLLDNMSPAALADAVAQVDGRAELEASGGITLDTVADVAASGVQFISVGAITHSAAALDLSLTVEVER
ncbi:MAG: carboxylating nicotinate-nucleotide diphosphorylase [Actinobacteria bacterium]|uniref:Probable nicotinate-nucleotide pyrophosphorylase [carboxylating] n=1 Tax=freshwater metagenome TaxID=449393 RepID=A0A6J5Z8H4_9ZZZZ|nr:carboxylating nicotinate-nucleotide diphosphorylase [Actinomycetota bacterium]